MFVKIATENGCVYSALSVVSLGKPRILVQHVILVRETFSEVRPKNMGGRILVEIKTHFQQISQQCAFFL